MGSSGALFFTWFYQLWGIHSQYEEEIMSNVHLVTGLGTIVTMLILALFFYFVLRSLSIRLLRKNIWFVFLIVGAILVSGWTAWYLYDFIIPQYQTEMLEGDLPYIIRFFIANKILALSSFTIFSTLFKNFSTHGKHVPF